MEITKTFQPKTRANWRQWLQEHHQSEPEIWLLYERATTHEKAITYLDIVEESLCFGWVDGIAKKCNDALSAQRLTPRRPKSNWTELNKERVRKLIKAGKMTDAGLKVTPDLSEVFTLSAGLTADLQKDSIVWQNFQSFPTLYQRIRASYVEDARRDPAEYKKRLSHLLENTIKKKMFGNWDDSGMSRSEPLLFE
jgi:hypothetical protein